MRDELQLGVRQRFTAASSKGNGEGGIRTPGTVARTAVFKTAALSRSATSPANSDASASTETEPFTVPR